jgi:hypothetical protein
MAVWSSRRCGRFRARSAVSKRFGAESKRLFSRIAARRDQWLYQVSGSRADFANLHGRRQQTAFLTI